ncbi:MAG TPA: hypothetical protein VKE51_35160 [Vicinamibacterales bacterium]|nr:hypothetical protein [Vicinamibacterales bacterium]
MSAVAILHRMLSAATRHGDPRGQLRRLFLEDTGQDVVEYALLTAFIGFAGAAAWDAMRASLSGAYSGVSGSVWDLWEPADPVGGGS